MGEKNLYPSLQSYIVTTSVSMNKNEFYLKYFLENKF